MTARMPIARRIMSGEQVLPDPQFASGGGERIVPSDLADFALFDIQVADELCHQRYADKVLRFSDLGPLRLPYPLVWMEFSAETLHEPLNVAVALSTPAGYAEGERVTMTTYVAAEKAIVACAVRVSFGLDEHGHGVPGSEEWILADADDRDHPGFLSRQQLLRQHVMAALMGLSLINCRNVTTEDKGRIQLARSGAQKRRGEPAKVTRYRTIVLPGGGSHADAKTGAHRPTALHRVRGHFKTFTAERPLLGRHVGTFWWGWSVRGDAEYGEVVSDYQLGKDRTA